MCAHDCVHGVFVRNSGLCCSGQSGEVVLYVWNDLFRIFNTTIEGVVVLSGVVIDRGVAAVGSNGGRHVLVYVSVMKFIFLAGGMIISIVILVMGVRVVRVRRSIRNRMVIDVDGAETTIVDDVLWKGVLCSISRWFGTYVIFYVDFVVI